LADAFLSFSKSGSGTVYTVPTANEGAIPPVLPTTTLVKSIYISKPPLLLSYTVTVTAIAPPD